MIFFEFSFRDIITTESILKAIQDYYRGVAISAYSFEEYYGKEVAKQNELPYIVYQYYHSEKGFATFFKGQAYGFDSGFDELSLGCFFAEKFNTEVVINNYRGQSSFLLIRGDKKIYYADPIGLGDPMYNSDIFEIDYETLVHIE